MSIPNRHNSDMRTTQPSRFDLPDELSSKAKALLGENYKQYSTLDKLKIISLFEKPIEKQRASESEQGILGEIRKRYKEIGSAGDALGKRASNMLKASLPTYVSPDLSSLQHASFESQLPKVIEKAEQAATQFAECSVGVQLQLYGFSLCAKYKGELNAEGGFANSYERLKQAGGGLASAALGYEYKEAFNRKLRTYLPEEQNRALEQLEAEPAYDVRKHGMVQVLELALTKLKTGALSETSSHTTTSNTTTTIATTTVTGTSLGAVTSRQLSDIETKQAASLISEPVNGLSHIARFCLYLQYEAGPTNFPFVTKHEDAALNEFEARLKEETGKLNNPADQDALLKSVLEIVRNLLPEHLKNELSKISILDSDSRKAEFERLAHSAFLNVKAGFRLSAVIQSKCSATAILHMIGYGFDRDENRLNHMNEEEKWQFDYACRHEILKEDPQEQQGFLCAFIGGVLSRAPEAVQESFREALLLLNPEKAKEVVLNLVAEYLKDPSAIEPLKPKDEAS
ncbi:hypothetical protein KTQ42_14425|uniref:hypothetical protein n=1 Tax=Noviherbaspirillum sp. L7-7A TaxID=2850560 RepID=UPI001C2BE529|nr:hypothetical protein [Noviherbaspirillum sp. L7-7A]MBV0880506.1 hypothetical protein [Noviherbaspirillum sp. L7-7A]